MSHNAENGKRLCIFCFYDPRGIVEAWDYYLLKQLKKVIDELIIVVNGFVTVEGREKLDTLSDQVVIRKNEGFDGKAYEYVVTECFTQDKLSEYDELVLCNNTFFGPFISFCDIFSSMEEKEIDFWGIDHKDEGVYRYICAYFLVFRKKILQNGAVFCFFSDNKKYQIRTKEDDVQLFEVGISSFMQHRGYTWDTYCWTHGKYPTLESTVCLKKYGMPILRKKGCRMDDQFSYENILESLDYIENAYTYDVSWIVRYIEGAFQMQIDDKRFYEINKEGFSYPIKKLKTNKRKLLVYLDSNRQVYIYGAGNLGGKIWSAYREDIKDFKGFLISDEIECDEGTKKFEYPVLYFADSDIDSLIIIAATTDKAIEMEENLIRQGYQNYLRIW